MVRHVNNILAFHVEDFQITLLVAKLAKVFKYNPTVKKSDVLDVLGINMDFLRKGKLVVLQIKYLAGVIHKFPERITKTAPTPAREHLFGVRDDYYPKLKKLSEE